MPTIVGIAIAGALGALARYGLEGVASRRLPTVFPWGTLAVNVSGALVLGFLFTLTTERVVVAPWLRSAIAVGFLGAYTTFSTFSLETLRLLEDGARGLALLNAAASVALGLAAVYAGVVLGRALP
ncbi:MAG: fluoride efflux transporter CrcB [Gaiellaceae bacterium]